MDERTQFFEKFEADTAHAGEFFGGGKGPGFNDGLGQRRTNAGEGFELLLRAKVEVDAGRLHNV